CRVRRHPAGATHVERAGAALPRLLRSESGEDPRAVGAHIGARRGKWPQPAKQQRPAIHADPRIYAVGLTNTTAARLERLRSRAKLSVLPRIGLEPSRLDAGDRAGLVAVGRVAGDADRADGVAGCGSDQYAAGIGDHATAAGRRQHGEELRRLRCARGERARAKAHAKRAPSLAERDVKAQEPGFVLTLERHQMTSSVEHSDSERRAVGVAPLLERAVDDD